MTIRTQVLFQSTVLLALVGGPFIPAASASLLASFGYTGTIVSGGTVTIGTTQYNVGGDSISGTFSYASPVTNPTSTGNYTLSGLTPEPALSFTITAIASGNPTQPLNVTDRYVYSATETAYQGAVAYSSTTGTTVSLTGPMNSGSTNFDLILGDTTNGGGFTSSNRPLPSSTTITNYFSPGHTTYTPTLILTDSVQQPLSEDFTVSINSLVATPEPSSLLIVGLTVATGALGFSVVSRLKRRKA